jgi:YbgC/YbaW family acyl-CoA thioester hydrolase
MISTESKRAQSSYKIRFNDCDMFGHLNNARYIDYMINARQDHLKDNYNFDYAAYYANNFGWVVAEHEIVYLKPARFDETVVISSQLVFADEGVLIAEIAMFNQAGDKLKCLMRTKFIPVNIASGKREKHTGDLLQLVNDLVVPGNLQADAMQMRTQAYLKLNN